MNYELYILIAIFAMIFILLFMVWRIMIATNKFNEHDINEELADFQQNNNEQQRLMREELSN